MKTNGKNTTGKNTTDASTQSQVYDAGPVKDTETNNTGGYEEISPDRKDVVEVFTWLEEKITSENASLHIESLNRVFIQVVAGYKYKLICSYKQDSKITTLEAIVYRRPDGVFELLNIIYQNE